MIIKRTANAKSAPPQSHCHPNSPDKPYCSQCPLLRQEGLSLDEVAERLGRTRNAVALLLSRALRKLKKKLEPRSDA